MRVSRSLSALTVCLLSACASKAPPQPSAPAPAPQPEAALVSEAEPEPEPEAPSCAGDDDCAAQGDALRDAGDRAGAQALYGIGCDADGLASCARLGSLVADDDAALAEQAWTKACEAGDLDSCLSLAQRAEPRDAVPWYERACAVDDRKRHEATCLKGAQVAYAAERYDAARTLAEGVCDEHSTVGCGVLGVLYAKGLGGEAQLDQARVAFERGCKGGDTEACGNLETLDRALEQQKIASVLPVERANVSIGSISVDGLSATNLMCRRDGGGGLFGGAMGALSGISKRKKKLMKCASKSEDVRVRWTTVGGKIKTVDAVASSPKVEGCVKKALRGASAAFGGTCAATFSLGK